MQLHPANNSFEPGNVIDLAAYRQARLFAAAAREQGPYGYELYSCGKTRVLTNLSTGQEICALA